METTQLQVAGMTCRMCVRHVTKALKEVAGVRSVAVDLASGDATVEHMSVEPQVLIDAVIEAGYSALTGSQQVVVAQDEFMQTGAQKDLVPDAAMNCTCCSTGAQEEHGKSKDTGR